MHIFIQILFWTLITFLGFIGIALVLSFAMALYSGLAVWLDYRGNLDAKNELEEKEPVKRGFFGTIKDGAVIVLWAGWYAVIFSISAFMTVLLIFEEAIETVFRKLRKPPNDYNDYF
jgi:hypothetical protein